jgi:hypothetical protein
MAGKADQLLRVMPLAEAPEVWLQLLLNDKELLDIKSLQSLMCANVEVCKAVLRCMRRWRLQIHCTWQVHACASSFADAVVTAVTDIWAAAVSRLRMACNCRPSL